MHTYAYTHVDIPPPEYTCRSIPYSHLRECLHRVCSPQDLLLELEAVKGGGHTVAAHPLLEAGALVLQRYRLQQTKRLMMHAVRGAAGAWYGSGTAYSSQREMKVGDEAKTG